MLSVPAEMVVPPVRPASLPVLASASVPASVLFRLKPPPPSAPLRVSVVPLAALMLASPVKVMLPLSVELPLARCSTP
ncbi:hypothetical protein D3C84_203160 [compost metagenome]